jgi:MoaA/NifB/PqqE/SkfB family radical SAM enzyme
LAIRQDKGSFSPARLARQGLVFVDLWLSRHLNRAPGTLPVLVIMFTDKCNLHCKMCGACDYSPGDHGMLSLEEWKRVVDSATRLGTQILSVTGGEAMLRKDVYDLMAYARGKGMAIHLNSNGLLLTEKNIAQLRESGVATVSISIESAVPALHDLIRGEGMHAKTLEGLRRLRAQAPEIHVGLNVVMSKHTLPGLHTMVDLAKREGARQIKFAPVHTNLQHRDKPAEDFVDLTFGPEDLPELDAELERIQQELAGSGVQSTSRKFFAGIRNLYLPPASNFYCYAGYAICTINAQGEVAACFDKQGTQNVRDTPLEEIWRSRAFHEHRQLVRNCDRACWDTTNAELSLKMTVRGMLREPLQTLRDIRFYFSRS